MRVANPIYDVVFKFLLGDMRIAKLIFQFFWQPDHPEIIVLPRN